KLSLPENVRGIRDQPSELEVRAQFSFPHKNPVRLAVMFPEGLESEADYANLLLANPSSERLLLVPFIGTPRSVCGFTEDIGRSVVKSAFIRTCSWKANRLPTS